MNFSVIWCGAVWELQVVVVLMGELEEVVEGMGEELRELVAASGFLRADQPNFWTKLRCQLGS